jgi:hypothetical protein
MLSPFLKTGPELKYNLSLFFRDQIEKPDAPYTRAPTWAVELAKADKGFAKATGMVPDYVPPDGGKTYGWSRKADYLFRQSLPGADRSDPRPRRARREGRQRARHDQGAAAARRQRPARDRVQAEHGRGQQALPRPGAASPSARSQLNRARIRTTARPTATRTRSTRTTRRRSTCASPRS